MTSTKAVLGLAVTNPMLVSGGKVPTLRFDLALTYQGAPAVVIPGWRVASGYISPPAKPMKGGKAWIDVLRIVSGVIQQTLQDLVVAEFADKFPEVEFPTIIKELGEGE